MVLTITSNVAMRNNEYQTGGNYPCLMIQISRNSQIRDSNLNHHTDSRDNLSSLLMNNNGDSNLSSLLMNNLNSNMDSRDNLNSLLMNNNGDSNLLRITLQRSMLHLLTAPNQFRAICHHSSPGGHDVVSGSC